MSIVFFSFSKLFLNKQYYGTQTKRKSKMLKSKTIFCEVCPHNLLVIINNRFILTQLMTQHDSQYQYYSKLLVRNKPVVKMYLLKTTNLYSETLSFKKRNLSIMDFQIEYLLKI